MDEFQILQIIPAVGWIANYKDPVSELAVWSLPLACWALVEFTWAKSPTQKKVVGLVTDPCGKREMICPENEDDFLGYGMTENQPQTIH